MSYNLNLTQANEKAVLHSHKVFEKLYQEDARSLQDARS